MCYQGELNKYEFYTIGGSLLYETWATNVFAAASALGRDIDCDGGLGIGEVFLVKREGNYPIIQGASYGNYTVFEQMSVPIDGFSNTHQLLPNTTTEAQ